MIIHVAVTDKMSWGKSDQASEAIIRAVRHAYKECGRIQIVEVKHEQIESASLLLRQVYVNELGGLVMPKGAVATTLGTIENAEHLSKQILAMLRRIGEVVENLE